MGADGAQRTRGANRGGELDVSDIDLLTAQVIAGTFSSVYDLNDDERVDGEDRRVWVQELANTWFGDANLDGEFNSGDFTQVFLAGEYEDSIEGNSGWAEGDWDGDGDFTSGDFTTAFLDGGYEQGPRPAKLAVPEPNAWLILVLGLAGAMFRRRRRGSSSRRATESRRSARELCVEVLSVRDLRTP